MTSQNITLILRSSCVFGANSFRSSFFIYSVPGTTTNEKNKGYYRVPSAPLIFSVCRVVAPGTACPLRFTRPSVRSCTCGLRIRLGDLNVARPDTASGVCYRWPGECGAVGPCFMGGLWCVKVPISVGIGTLFYI